jgi:uncharacterized protein YqhQ
MADAGTVRLGGMALANGLLVYGPTHWAAAIRGDDGEIRVASGRKLRLARGPLAGIPLLRGVLRLAEAIAVIPEARRSLPEARLAIEEAPIGVAFALSGMVAALARWRLRSVLAQEAVGAVAGLVPALVAVSRSDAALWHGVEHKSIAAYESGGEVASAPKEHERCGGNLILPLLVATTLGRAAARTLYRQPPPLVRLAVAAGSIGTAVEVFAFSTRHPEHPLSRVVHRAGHLVQSACSTREPRAEDLAVGRAAMDEILRLERR